jgi:hypothetical protein
VGLGADTATQIRRLERGLSDLVQGVCESVSWVNGLATVNVNGGSLPMPMIGSEPLVGWKVWVAYLGTQPICLGPVARSARGAVNVAATGGFVGVLGDDGVSYLLPYLGAAPALAARVAILWDLGGVVAGTLSAEPVGSTVVVPPAQGAAIKTFTFYPTASGNWTGSGYNSIADPYCSASVIGAFFYGNVLPDTIPNSADFIAGSLKIYLSEFYNQFPSSKATLGRHNRASKSGDPTPTDTFTLPNLLGVSSPWVTLPNAWEDNFRLGSARGVAFNHGGYHKYRRAGSGLSGVIVGKWRV